MRYPEYLKTAERHLTTCQKLYESIAWTETSQWEIFKEVMKNKPSNRQLKENLSKLRSLFNKFRDEFFEKVRWLYSKKDSLDKSEFIKKENLLDRRKCRLKQLESVLKQWEDDLKKEKEKVKNFIIMANQNLKVNTQNIKMEIKQFSYLNHILL